MPKPWRGKKSTPSVRNGDLSGMLKTNPCTSCGACCAYFRVSFLKESPEGACLVPAEFREELEETRWCMQGTNQTNPKCVCLKGEIGVSVSCGIYRSRPGPCRKFGIQWSLNSAAITERDYIFCNRARHFWKLPRLSRRRLAVIPSVPEEQTFEEAR